MRIATLFALLTAVSFAPAAVQAQQLEFPAATKPCITCHGKDGIGKSPLFPNIAGQKSLYMIEQLMHFRDGKRQGETTSIITESLTDDDIRIISEYYEAQSACKQ